MEIRLLRGMSPIMAVAGLGRRCRIAGFRGGVKQIKDLPPPAGLLTLKGHIAVNRHGGEDSRAFPTCANVSLIVKPPQPVSYSLADLSDADHVTPQATAVHSQRVRPCGLRTMLSKRGWPQR